jgi:hypothetical protein
VVGNVWPLRATIGDEAFDTEYAARAAAAVWGVRAGLV